MEKNSYKQKKKKKKKKKKEQDIVLDMITCRNDK